jgi:hypothetical protein
MKKAQISIDELLTVVVSKKSFLAAKDSGAVTGKINSIYPPVYVYVELGEELEYLSKPKDDKNTEYRIFHSCTVCFAKNEQERDAGIFIAEPEGCLVRLAF